MANVSDFIIGRLREWGVTRIYGYPGDGINGLVGAIARVSDELAFIQVRHEEQAAFMAAAHAKFTGELGVCLATSGPGGIHLLNGLYDAKADHVPVLAIVGQAATTALGGSYQQEVDFDSLYKDVASDYLTTIASPVAARHAVDRAVRTALARKSVTAIVVPKDVQEMSAVDEPPHKHDMLHSSIGYSKPRVLPTEVDLDRIAELLNAGSRVALLVGHGATGATDAIVEVADALGAGCAKALLGKAVVPDDYPWVTGTIGLLGTYASSEMMSHCDTLLMVGTSFPYSEFLPKAGQARAVQIDIDGKNLGLRYATEINVVGDARETLLALLPKLRADRGSEWRAQIATWREHDERVDATRATIAANPINPEVVFTELSPRLPDDCIVTGDAGTATNFLARHLRMRRGMKFALSGGLATMGSAVPYAIAAKFAFPDRVAIALTGDGAMQMNGLNELITVKRYWEQWSDPLIIFLVMNNRDLNQVSWEMRIESGDPKFEGSQSLPDFPYARFAELLGFTGIKVERPEDVGAAWERALSADRPVVIEAMVDGDISLLPAHITFEQASSFAKALLKGDPDEGSIIAKSVKGVIAGIFPTREEQTT